MSKTVAIQDKRQQWADEIAHDVDNGIHYLGEFKMLYGVETAEHMVRAALELGTIVDLQGWLAPHWHALATCSRRCGQSEGECLTAGHSVILSHTSAKPTPQQIEVAIARQAITDEEWIQSIGAIEADVEREPALKFRGVWRATGARLWTGNPETCLKAKEIANTKNYCAWTKPHRKPGRFLLFVMPAPAYLESAPPEPQPQDNLIPA